jgi:hypothetical protein
VYRHKRLVRSVTTSEPRWTEQDRAEALALAAYRAALCPGGCGQPVEESTAHYEHGPGYDVGRTTCRACVALVEAQRAADDGGRGDNKARLWHVERKAVD